MRELVPVRMTARTACKYWYSLQTQPNATKESDWDTLQYGLLIARVVLNCCLGLFVILVSISDEEGVIADVVQHNLVLE